MNSAIFRSRSKRIPCTAMFWLTLQGRQVRKRLEERHHLQELVRQHDRIDGCERGSQEQRPRTYAFSEGPEDTPALDERSSDWGVVLTDGMGLFQCEYSPSSTKLRATRPVATAQPRLCPETTIFSGKTPLSVRRDATVSQGKPRVPGTTTGSARA